MAHAAMCHGMARSPRVNHGEWVSSTCFVTLTRLSHVTLADRTLESMDPAPTPTLTVVATTCAHTPKTKADLETATGGEVFGYES